MSLSGIWSTIFAGALVLATPVYAVETRGIPGGHGAAFGGESGIAAEPDDASKHLAQAAGALAQRESDWLAAPPDPDRHTLWVPTAEWAVALSLTIPLFMIDPSFVHVGPISADTFADAWTRAPEWDGDGIVANYVLHPLMGAEAYLTVRNRDYGPMESFLFSTGVSFAWEYLFEAWVEQPSAQDLLLTSPVGSLYGELRFQIRRRLAQWNPSLARNALLILVDPIEAIHRYIGKDDAEEETMSSSVSVGPDQAKFMLTLQF
ncbi:MAG TPA: DUF3943 domain-containing protein [Candidatus Binatia bacterium]|nr:DUF3943 domain-containing protein [Candidatus Binatia bacterium]